MRTVYLILKIATYPILRMETEIGNGERGSEN